MRRIIAVLLVTVASAAAPAAVDAGGFDVRVGGFVPRAESNLFTDDAELYGTTKSDFRSLGGGAEYEISMGDHFELGIHADGFGRNVQSSYVDFVTPSGREITQTLKLAVVPMGLSLRFLMTDPGSSFVPWVAAGPDLVYWRYEETGDFVDFETSDIIADSFESHGTTPGAHVSAGARINVSDDVAVTAEGRYLWGGADMGHDFRGNRIDVTGFAATIGVHLRF